MLPYGEFKFWNRYSSDERERYCLFDEYGCIVGIKENVPSDFKEAYKEYEKIKLEWEERGIDV